MVSSSERKLEEFYAIGDQLASLLRSEEELIYRGNDFLGHQLRSPIPIRIEDALIEAGIFGESRALQDVLEKLQSLAKHRNPVVFVGEGGSGKKTFARLLHCLGAAASNACLTVDCRELLPSYASGETPESILRPLRSAIRPSAILAHPEVLTRTLRRQLLMPLEEQPTAIRHFLIVDKAAAESFLRNLDPTIRRMLLPNVVNIPSLHDRRSDLKLCILAKLRELNRKSGLQKKLAAPALERLLVHDYERNFESLHRILEKLHATQPDIISFDGDLRRLSTPIGSLTQRFPLLGETDFNLDRYLSQVRHKMIWDALEMSAHNQSRAAKFLGVTPQAINKFLKTRKPS